MRKPEIDALFIAVPELTFNFNFVEYLASSGLLSNDQYKRILQERARAKKADKLLAASMNGDTILRRLLSVASELVTEDTVNLLSGFGSYRKIISIKERPTPGIGVTDDLWRKERLEYRPLLKPGQASALKLAIRTLNASTRGGLPADPAQIFTRLLRVLDANIAQERINMWRAMGLISKQDAERWSGYLRVGRGVQESFAKARRAKTLLDALLILGDMRVGGELIDTMVSAGILDARLGRTYKNVIALGVKQWRVFEGVRKAEGLAARMQLMLTGSMNAQLLDFLVDQNIITRSQWVNMQLLEIAARNVNDNLLEKMVKRRYRVKPGEAPIKTYARAARITDGELLRLLADASREASKEANALAGGIGKQTRARQYNIAARQLHVAMRNMWDGVGYLTIWGERQVADAAIESAYAMQRSLLTGRFAQLGEALEWQAKAGVDAYISREENVLPLSRRVYKNQALWQGNVDKRIKLSLLQGKSAAEIAEDVKKYINPNVRGGVSYAAMRLGRTEINNAFHFTTIRHTRENPWVRGYKWNLSGSHGRPDVCNQMASDDHDGLGEGVYKKANVPGKPHPHCLCYITVVQMDEAEFAAAFRAGRFDRYLESVELGRAVSSDRPSSADLGSYARAGFANLSAELKNQ